MSEEALRIVGDVEIAKLSLSPGDVLVVRTTQMLSMDSLERVLAHLRPKLPDGVKCLIVDPCMELSVLTRAEIDAKAA